MNRFFGITGVFAGVMVGFLTCFFCSLPLLGLPGGPNPPNPLAALLLWAVGCAVGIGTIVAFLLWSLLPHWNAIRRNTPMTTKAWRGVCSPYLLLTVAFALPVFAGDPSGTHEDERYLYMVVTTFGLLLTTLAVIRAIPNYDRDTTSTEA